MEIGRLKYLKEEAEAQRLGLDEVAEIEEAFAKIPYDELRDVKENALADDMLEELEARISPVERIIYDYVSEHFGESEANDPSWSIGPLAKHIESKLKEEE